jgi:putative peptide zinc metalloprotease protein
MTTAARHLVAAERPIPLRVRGDLEYLPLGVGRGPYWRIKDPVALRHFELGEYEYFILQQLDGETSVGALQAECARRFAPKGLGQTQLSAFLARLHRDALVLADASGQGAELLRRDDARRRQQRVWGWTRLLAMRWRGIDPQPLLDRVEPWSGWVFSRWAMAGGLAIVLTAIVLLLTHYDAARLRVPEFQAFFSLRNAPWLMLSVACAKVLHELAHALACRRYGGECHELGIMLLVFVPCLYCDVSDAWMFKSRWQRAAVGAAGLYAELVLAAGCALLWWFSEPGWLNSICFNLTVVCSVSTLAFNGNPLLRYDGYFILSDLSEIPNLQQRAAAVLRRALSWCVLAAEPPREIPMDERSTIWLAVYGVAALAYRWMASLAIVWFCYQALKPHRLASLAALLGAVVIAALLATPARQVAQFFRDPSWSGKVHWPRAVAGALLCGVAVAAIWFVPLPHRVRVPAVVEPAGARRVYVSAPGTLRSAVQAGEHVEAGQTLAQLGNPEMELELVELRGERDRLHLRLANLKRRQIDSVEAGLTIPTAAEALADAERRFRQRMTDQQRLTLAAPRSGAVFPARRRHQPVAAGDLPDWSGSPLDKENQGCYLETGTQLCVVGDPAQWEAVLLVDEDQVAFVHAGQSVEVLLDQAPESVLRGTIADVAKIDLQEAPPELIEHGEMPSRPDASGERQPVRTYYQARVNLDSARPALLAGSTGEAKIFADPQPLGPRILRFLTGTFRFEL